MTAAIEIKTRVGFRVRVAVIQTRQVKIEDRHAKQTPIAQTDE
jgi:hypothetical protein